MNRHSLILGGILTVATFAVTFAETPPARPKTFLAGAARVNITPPTGLPMWGYGARKSAGCQGVLKDLWATAVIISDGETRLALVGLDTGRSPARKTVEKIQNAARRVAGVQHVLLVGSHTHNGPCLELVSTPPTAQYIESLAAKLVDALARAAKDLRPAKLGMAAREVDHNRNRHTKIAPKPVDPWLTVMRIDDLKDKPIALIVNFAAHPTTIPASILKWSPDFVGYLRDHVEKEWRGTCVYLQGACGDLSTNRRGKNTEQYGVAVANDCIELARSTMTEVPKSPTLQVREEEFRFSSRVDFSDQRTYLIYCLAFFKELVDAYVEEYKDGVRPRLTVALLNGQIGIVGVSGEVFSDHANRLRRRSRLPYLVFCGYANGYHQYFPTIEAVAEGGYGADAQVSPVEIGAGEKIMDRALFHLYDLRRPMK